MKSLDRRYLKTEKIILDSMISLLNQKRFQDIQIEDICSKADINKSTFYLHYQSLYQLLSSLEDSFVSSLEKIVYESNPKTFQETVPSLVQYFKDNKRFASALFRSNDYRFNEKITSIFLPLFCNAKDLKKKTTLSENYLLGMGIVDAVLAILRTSVLNGTKLSEEFISSTLLEFLNRGTMAKNFDK